VRHLVIAVRIAAGLAPAAVAVAEGNAAKGRDIAIKYCARCHVVGDYNPSGGIGSTPSFQLLAKRRPDFVERFQTFYARRPHPVHVRVPGIPPWTNLPPNATPFTVTLEEVDDIVAFAKTLKK